MKKKKNAMTLNIETLKLLIEHNPKFENRAINITWKDLH